MAINFDDLDKLPDDVKYELPDGTTVTLGEIREAAKTHAESIINKRISDLTPREQKIAERERTVATQEKMVREAMVTLANTPPPPTTVNPNAPLPPLGYTPEQWAAIQADPYSRPLVSTLAMLAEKTEKLEKALQERDLSTSQREQLDLQRREAEWIQYQFEKMAESNKEYKDPTKRQALLDYAKDVLTRRDLTVLDRAMNFDVRMKESEETGYQRGIKEGRGAAAVPSIPHGTRAVPTPAPPEKLPATFNEFVDGAANDAAFIQEVREAASSPNPVS